MAKRVPNNEINLAHISEKLSAKTLPDKNKQKYMNKKTPSISIYRKIAITFVVLTVLLALIVAYFSVVSVKIVIIPNQERTTSEFTATVVDRTKNQEAQGLSLTGVVEPVEASVSQTFATAGIEIKDVAVSGTVTIYNNRASEQPLVSKTRLLSPDGRLYRLLETVRVPARGQLENVPVQADKADKSMEIGPSTFTLPGLNQSAQKLVYAESKEKFTYQEIGDAVVSEVDLAGARETLKGALNEKITAMSKDGKYGNYDNVLYHTEDNAIIYETDAKAGSRVGEFVMSAQVSAALVAFDTKDMAALAKLKVAENLPDDKQLQGFDENNFQFDISSYDANAGTATVKVSAAAQMVLKDGADIINPERLIGLSREQLDDYLSARSEIAGYEVKFTPSWINKVPSLVDHIKIEIAK